MLLSEEGTHCLFTPFVELMESKTHLNFQYLSVPFSTFQYLSVAPLPYLQLPLFRQDTESGMYVWNIPVRPEQKKNTRVRHCLAHHIDGCFQH